MDWFKMQTVWGASLSRFSDAEAGRFLKALYAYVRDGEEYTGCNGREDPLVWQALETLREDVESFKQAEANQKAEEEALREKRKQAAKARWGKQNDASASMCNAKNASASTCMICNASASENQNKNNIIIKENPLKGVKEKTASRFTPPTLDEVTDYCRERQNGVDPQRFVDFYASKGWKVGNQPMKDWRAAVRTWERKEGGNSYGQPAQPVRTGKYDFLRE